MAVELLANGAEVGSKLSETAKSFDPDKMLKGEKFDGGSKSFDPDKMMKGEDFNEQNQTLNAKETIYKEDNQQTEIIGKTSEDVPKLIIDNGKKFYFDEKDVLYRENQELVPNNSYEINGYTYQTDEFGRIKNVSGKLHLKEHHGRLDIEDNLHDIGKGYENKETDDRGHLIGDQFGGAPRLENLIPQDSKINQGIYKKLEDQLAKEVKNGHEVYSDLKVLYEGDSRRPSSIVYNYSIDGEKFMEIFPNNRSSL